MAIDIVSCPMKNGGSFHSFVNVRLPEANSIRFLDGKTTVSRSLGSVVPITGSEIEWTSLPLLVGLHGDVTPIVLSAATSCVLSTRQPPPPTRCKKKPSSYNFGMFWALSWANKACYLFGGPLV